MNISTRRKVNNVLAKTNKKSCSICNNIFPLESFGEHTDTRILAGYSIGTRCSKCWVVKRTNSRNETKLKELLTK